MAATAQEIVQISSCPFRGLRPFSKEESDLFFGREGQSDELARKLGQTCFVAVVGTSGSGKSSLVRAGLLPSLDSGCLVKAGSSWRVVDMRPGGDPIHNLAIALDAAGLSDVPVDPEVLANSSLALLRVAQTAYKTNRLQDDECLLILVDQFEELFRYKTRDTMQDRDQKAAFVKLLLEASKQRKIPIYVVITMRSEFLGDCASFRDLPEAINAGQYLIPRMSREQRRQAIEGPIRMAGGEIAARLVQRILNEVGEDPGQLPVMQHALLRTWIHWKNQGQPQRSIDFEDYDAVGTMAHAVSQHANETFEEVRNKLGARGATIVRRLFQRLSNRDQYGRETRRPTGVQELMEVCEASLEEIETAVNCFRQEGRNFLTPPSEKLSPSSEIDVTHECLLRKWRLLSRDWNPEEEESRRVYLRILARARDALHTENDQAASPTGRFRDYLTGYLLDRSLAWWGQRQPNRAWARRYAYDEGKLAEVAADSQFALAQRYLLESKRHATNARFRKYFFVMGLAGLIGLAVIGFWYRYKSEIAMAKENLMEAELASSVVCLSPGTPKDDPRVTAFRAAGSLRHNPSLEARTILLQALVQLPPPPQQLPTRNAADVAFSSDGRWLAVAGSGSVDLYEVTTGKQSKSILFEGTAKKLLFPSRFFFMVGLDKKILIWQYDKKQKDWMPAPIEPGCRAPAALKSFAVDRAGTLLAAVCEVPGDSDSTDNQSAHAALSKDKRPSSYLALWTPSTKAELPTDVDCASPSSMALSSDGTRIAYVCAAEKAWIVRLRLIVNDSQKEKLSFGPSKALLALDKKAAAQVSSGKDTASEQQMADPYADAKKWSSPKGVKDLKFDPTDADVLIIAGTDDTVRSWNYGGTRTLLAAKSPEAAWANKPHPSEPSNAGSSGLYEPAEEGYKFPILASAGPLSFSEDGRWIAVTNTNHVAKVWDAKEIASDRLIAHLALDHPIKSIAVSRVGEHIAAVTDNGVAYLWKLTSKRSDFPEFSILQAHGNYLITHDGTDDFFMGTTSIIDTHTYHTVSSFGPSSHSSPRGYRPLAISRDGSLVAGLSKDRVITVNEFSERKIGKELWKSESPKDSFYVTSFGFSRDNRYLMGAFKDSNSDKIWLAVWELTKPDALVGKVPVAPGSSYDLISGAQVLVATPKQKTHLYDAAAGKTVPVPWGAHNFAAIDLSPDRKTIVGAEVDEGCIAQDTAQTNAGGSQATPGKQEISSTIWFLNRENGEKESKFKIPNYCVYSLSMSADARYLLVIAATGSEDDSRTILQLWDVHAQPPVESTEIRNGATILDADIAPDSRELVLVDRKRVIVTPWRQEDLTHEFCSRVVPNDDEKREYQNLCPASLNR